MQATPTPTPAPEKRPVALPPFPEPVTVPYPPNHNDPPFHVMTGIFNKLQNEKKPAQREKFLQAFFNRWRSEVGPDVYPAMRLLLPHKDKERAVYGLKEKNIAKIYTVLLNIDGKDTSVRPPRPFPDAAKLQDWKKPSDQERRSTRAAAADFPSIVREIVQGRSVVLKGDMTVGEVNDVLDELSKCNGKLPKQTDVYKTIVNRCMPDEQRWIVAILLKDMVISTTEVTMFKIFHPDAQDLFNTCSDLKKVVHDLYDPTRRLNSDEIVIKLFQPFAPMLCKRPAKLEDSIKEVTHRSKDGLFMIEEKLDGERMQLHKRGDEFFYCSRKGKNYTYMYGAHEKIGSLTPYIVDCFREDITDFILDGELLVYDPTSAQYLKFGTLKTAALDTSGDETRPHPCFKIFDLVYVNGQSLLNHSTKARKNLMKQLVTEKKGRIEYVACDYASTAKEVRQRMEQVVMDRGEGLVLKHADAKYVLNGRNSDWIKVKPEYLDSMGETVDVLVVGGNYGSARGQQSGGVSTFVCAVLDDTSAEDEQPLQYRTFVRIGTGFTYADYVWIRGKNWKEWSKNSTPSFLKVAAKGRDDKCDMYIEPEDSFIVRVKAAEITSTDQYHMGYTMRFPRATGIRDDKGLEDCMKSSEVYDAKRTVGKRKAPGDEPQVTKKKRKVTKKKDIMSTYRGVKTEDVPVESGLFKGMNFTVLSRVGDRFDEEKKAIERMILAHGGQRFQNMPRGSVEAIGIYDGDKRTGRVSECAKKDCDVIRSKWLVDSIHAGEKVPLQKHYFYSAGRKSMAADAYTLGEEIVDEPVKEMVLVKDEAEIKAEYGQWAGFHADLNEPAAAPDSDTESEPDEAVVNVDSATEDEDDWDVVTDGVAGIRLENEVKDENEDIVMVHAPDDNAAQPKDEQEEVVMGEPGAMEYDTDMIFRHLCFYLDAPANARANDIPFKSKQEDTVTEMFNELERAITANGGQIVAFNHSKLTHIILDPQNKARRLEIDKLIRKRSKRPRMITPEYITMSIDEHSLQNEEDYMP